MEEENKSTKNIPVDEDRSESEGNLQDSTTEVSPTTLGAQDAEESSETITPGTVPAITRLQLFLPPNAANTLSDVSSIEWDEDVRRSSTSTASSSEGVRKRKSEAPSTTRPPLKRSTSTESELSEATQDQLVLKFKEPQTVTTRIARTRVLKSQPEPVSQARVTKGGSRCKPPMRKAVSYDVPSELEKKQPVEKVCQREESYPSVSEFDTDESYPSVFESEGEESYPSVFEPEEPIPTGELRTDATNTSSAEEQKEDEREETQEENK